VNVPVRLNSDDQDAWVYPGDYIIADLDGVVCIPAKLAAQTVELAAKIVARDERCAEDIRSGRSVQETFKEHRGK
jgi:regulator of RNase E activity RraA